MFGLQPGRPLSDLLVVGFGETCGGRSQFELVMGGGGSLWAWRPVGPCKLQTRNVVQIKRTRGQWDYFAGQLLVTCHEVILSATVQDRGGGRSREG